MNIKNIIIESLKNEIEKQEKVINIYDIVIEILKPFEGQKISKRLATALKKSEKLKDYNINYKNDYRMYHIEIWKKADYKGFNVSLLIGYDNNPIFHIGDPLKEHSGITYFSACYGHWEKERLSQNKELLNNNKRIDKFANIIENYIYAKKEFENLNFNALYAVKEKLNIK
jgi:hypothetical protein